MDTGGRTRPAVERAAQVVRTVSLLSVPVLIVLDNVTRWSVGDRPSPLPEGAHLRYLVTTRQSRLGGARFEHVNVGFLEAEFARQLLERVSRPQSSSVRASADSSSTRAMTSVGP